VKILLALGANLSSEWGKPAETLYQAVERLSEGIGAQVDCSKFFATKAYPAGSGPDFVNAAAALESDYTPYELLEICHRIERQARRTRDQRWGPRTLDIDLIACDQLVLPDEPTQSAWRTLPEGEQLGGAPQELILPHPRVQDRAFVLVPLADVAPDWRHPVLGLSTAEMLARLPVVDQEAVIPLKSL